VIKKAFYIGVILGGALGIAIALSMDIILGKVLGSGWREAVANDLNRIFQAGFSENHFIVIIGTIIVIGIIGVFGAFIGGIFSVMIARLFEMLTKEH
jgi:hypothetical protein